MAGEKKLWAPEGK